MPLSEACQRNLYSPECQFATYTPTELDPYGALGNMGGNVGGGGAVIASPSTVWTGTGVYSRTLQSILSGIGLLRGAQTIPTAVQLQAQQNPSYGGQQAQQNLYIPPPKAPSNFSGKLQALIEKYPGTIAVGGALLVAVMVTKKGLRSSPRY